MRYLAISLGLLILCSKADAQEVMWGRDLVEIQLQEAGVYLTPPAERSFRGRIANDFSAGAVQAGFPRDQASAFANAVAFGKVYSVGGGRAGYYVANSPSLDAAAKIPGDAAPLVRYLFSFTNREKLSVYLQKFSTIKINVDPVPPRDYSVVINDDMCPATEKGEYKVLPGKSTVKVTRLPKPSCDWSGTIQEGGTQLVACKF
jgi:hypothetical protein